MKKKGWFGLGLAIILLVIVGLIFISKEVSHILNPTKESFTAYDKHYVFISGSADDNMWEQIYASAVEEGKKRGVYVERFGNQLVGNYFALGLVDLAVQASVDGIIFCGSEEVDTVEHINAAVDAGIPIVTVYQDCTASKRQCFVGANAYNIGLMYGEQIIEQLQEEEATYPQKKISVLVDDSSGNASQHLTVLGIREAMKRAYGSAHAIVVETVPLDGAKSFQAEEYIRDVFINSDEMPDFLVCLNAGYTQCACQAAVDYNKVGQVAIYGYYDSKEILDAVDKEIMVATFAPDTKALGEMSVQALDEYVETGYTNNYVSVGNRLITKQNVRWVIHQKEQEVDDDET